MEELTELTELTICTVSFHHDDFVRKNVDLSARLNPESVSRFRWIVVENTPAATVPLAKLDAPCRVESIEGESPLKGSGPSDHHAAAVNKALERVTTPYLLVIDPDFFILRKHWIDEVLQHMKARNLAALGAPWNPVWYSKPRYVPACAHCLFLDLRQFDRRQLDFRPAPAAAVTPRVYPIPGILKGPLETALQYQRLFWQSRKTVGRDRDTGYRIAEAVENGRLPFECFVPVFDPSRDSSVPRLFRALDRFFDDDLRYVPGNQAFFARSGFEKFGVESARRIGCEEFLWKNAPFGVHFRGQPKRMTGEYSAAKDRLFGYLDRIRLQGFPPVIAQADRGPRTQSQ